MIKSRFKFIYLKATLNLKNLKETDLTLSNHVNILFMNLHKGSSPMLDLFLQPFDPGDHLSG